MPDKPSSEPRRTQPLELRGKVSQPALPPQKKSGPAGSAPEDPPEQWATVKATNPAEPPPLPLKPKPLPPDSIRESIEDAREFWRKFGRSAIPFVCFFGGFLLFYANGRTASTFLWVFGLVTTGLGLTGIMERGRPSTS